MIDMTGEEIISLLENYNVKITLSKNECLMPISAALSIRTYGYEQETINIWNTENGRLHPDERYTGSLVLNLIKDNGGRIPDREHVLVYTREELVEALDLFVELDRKSKKLFRKEMLDAV